MMSAIGEISSFLTREAAAATSIAPPPASTDPATLSWTDVATRTEPANGAAVEPGHQGA
jgi:hypothetical protein